MMKNWTEEQALQAIEEKSAALRAEKTKLHHYETSLSHLGNIFEGQKKQQDLRQKTIANLDKLTLSNVFYRISGKMEEKVTKEEAEYLDAKLKLEELENSILLTEKEIQTVKDHITLLEKDFDEWANAAKTQFPAVSHRFDKIQEQRETLKAQAIEVDEAITAGKEVQIALDSAIDQMKSARGLATYDVIGGGLFSHMLKYDNIDKAQTMIKEIGHLSDKFKAELQDLDVDLQGLLTEYSGSLRFIDYFFDNIFVDFNVRDKIVNDIDGLIQFSKEVDKIINDLVKKQAEIEKQLAELPVYGDIS